MCSKSLFKLFVVLPVLLVSCGPLTVYHRPGVSEAQLDREYLACEVSALKQAPVANQIRQHPPRYYPGHRYCNSEGACWTTPGYWIDGGSYTVDVNQGVRSRLLQSCMAKKGYLQQDLPRCSNLAYSVRRPNDVIQITPKSCAKRDDSGRILILEQN